MKRVVIILAVIALIAGTYAALGKRASALSIFGIKLSFSSSQTTTTTENGKTTTTHSSNSYQYDTSRDNGSDPCFRFKNHEYEVCTAYVANSVIADLVLYYTFVHSDESFMKQFASDRLGSRYTGQAQRVITNRTSRWPDGYLDVGVPKIDIMSVNSDLSANTATLHTSENWSVKTDSGQVVYSETGQHHAIIMHRVPSYVLHKWVVIEID